RASAVARRHGANWRRCGEDKPAREGPYETPAQGRSGPGKRLQSVRMPSDPATVAEEEYLQIIFWLHEAGLPMTGANIARAMQLSAPTVHEMIGRLERDGYVTRGTDKVLAFTDSGLEHAEGIVRRHRLIERVL